MKHPAPLQSYASDNAEFRGRPEGGLTRRSLIWRMLLMIATAPAALMGCASRGSGSVEHPLAESLPAPGYPSLTRLSSAEAEDLVAFGEVLVEGRTLAPVERQYLAEYLDTQTRIAPEYLTFCRAATKMLNRLAGGRFSTLDVPTRLEIISRHGLAGGREASPPSSEENVLRTRMVPGLIRAYYASPAGWAIVGYQTFPGRCGILDRYSRPEA